MCVCVRCVRLYGIRNKPNAKRNDDVIQAANNYVQLTAYTGLHMRNELFVRSMEMST